MQELIPEIVQLVRGSIADYIREKGEIPADAHWNCTFEFFALWENQSLRVISITAQPLTGCSDVWYLSDPPRIAGYPARRVDGEGLWATLLAGGMPLFTLALTKLGYTTQGAL